MKSFNTIQVAESLSLALHPFILLPLIFLIALFLTPFPSLVSQSRWLAMILIGNFLIPLWLIFYLDQQGFVLDDTLANKQLYRKRLVALLPVDIILSIEIIAMLFGRIHEPLFAVFLSCLVVTIVGGIISYYWKISAHALGLSTSITLLTLLVSPWAVLGALTIPLLAWSRLVLHRHTLWQLVGGTLVAPVLIIPIFVVLHLL